MPCYTFTGRDGSTFIACASSPIREKRQRCSVCGSKWATRLCDGREPGAKRTCDAPLCDGCTVQSEPLIRLPDFHQEGIELTALKMDHHRNNAKTGLAARALGEKRVPLSPGEDALDFCPRHRESTQGTL